MCPASKQRLCLPFQHTTQRTGIKFRDFIPSFSSLLSLSLFLSEVPADCLQTRSSPSLLLVALGGHGPNPGVEQEDMMGQGRKRQKRRGAERREERRGQGGGRGEEERAEPAALHLLLHLLLVGIDPSSCPSEPLHLFHTYVKAQASPQCVCVCTPHRHSDRLQWTAD